MTGLKTALVYTSSQTTSIKVFDWVLSHHHKVNFNLLSIVRRLLPDDTQWACQQFSKELSHPPEEQLKEECCDVGWVNTLAAALWMSCSLVFVTDMIKTNKIHLSG